MAQFDNTIKSTVILDTNQAEQQIVRLNSVASDTTKKLEERIAAKNEAIKLQTQLSKQLIATQEEEIDILKELGESQKELTKLNTKLNSEKLKSEKIDSNNVKQLNKLNSALESSKAKIQAAARAKAEASAQADEASRNREEQNSKRIAYENAISSIDSKRETRRAGYIQQEKEIIRLNGVAGDTTKSYEERINAKNEQIKLSNNLRDKTIRGIEEEIKELKELGGQEKRIKTLTEELNREQVKFEKNTAQNVKQLNKLDKALENSSKRTNIFKGGLSQLALRFTAASLVASAFLKGLQAIWRGMKDAARRVVEFDKTMQEMAGIVRESRRDMQALENTIVEVASKSIKTSNEVAKLASTLLTLGKTKSEVQDLLEPVNNLSIAMKASSEDAGEFLVQTLNAFGAGTDEAQKYADTIAAIRTSTTLDFQRMRDSFQYIAPISKLLNEDLEYTGALVGVLADNGLKAESAGRLLATAQIKLAKGGRTLNEGLAEISEAYKNGAKDIEIMALAGELFGQNAARVGAILATNTAQIEEYTAEIRKSSGALDDLVNNQLESLDARIKILDSTWEKFILNIDNGTGVFSEFAKTFIDGTADIISSLDDINTSDISFGELLKLAFDFSKTGEEVDALIKKMADVVRTESKRVDTLNSIVAAKEKELTLIDNSIEEVSSKELKALEDRKDAELKVSKEIYESSTKNSNLTKAQKEFNDKQYLSEKETIENKYLTDRTNLEINTLRDNISKKKELGEVSLQEELLLIDKEREFSIFNAQIKGEDIEAIEEEYRQKKLALTSTYTDKELNDILRKTEANYQKLLDADRKAREQKFLDDNKAREAEEAKNKRLASEGKAQDFIESELRKESDLKFEIDKQDLERRKLLGLEKLEYDRTIAESEIALAITKSEELGNRATQDAQEALEKALEGVENQTIINEATEASASALAQKLKDIDSDLVDEKLAILQDGLDREQEIKDNVQAEKEDEASIQEDKVSFLEEQIAEDEAEIERKILHNENVYFLELELVEKKKELVDEEAAYRVAAYNALTDEEKKYAKDVEAINKESAEKKAAIVQDSERRKSLAMKASTEQSIALTAEAFGFQKEAALAMSIMAVPEALTGVFKANAGKPFPLNVIGITQGIATNVAPIFTQIRAIQQANLKGSNNNGGGGTANAPSIPSVPSVGTSVIGDISANNAARLGVDPSLSQGADAAATSRVGATTSGDVVFSENKYNNFKNQVEFKENKTSI